MLGRSYLRIIRTYDMYHGDYEGKYDNMKVSETRYQVGGAVASIDQVQTLNDNGLPVDLVK